MGDARSCKISSTISWVLLGFPWRKSIGWNNGSLMVKLPNFSCSIGSASDPEYGIREYLGRIQCFELFAHIIRTGLVRGQVRPRNIPNPKP